MCFADSTASFQEKKRQNQSKCARDAFQVPAVPENQFYDFHSRISPEGLYWLTPVPSKCIEFSAGKKRGRPGSLSPSEVRGLSANRKLVPNGLREIQSECPQSIRNALAIVNGGSDGTRTRGLLRDS